MCIHWASKSALYSSKTWNWKCTKWYDPHTQYNNTSVKTSNGKLAKGWDLVRNAIRVTCVFINKRSHNTVECIHFTIGMVEFA